MRKGNIKEGESFNARLWPNGRVPIDNKIAACGHFDKKGEYWYQISLGGNSSNDAKIGKILGKAVPTDAVATTIQKIIDVYLEQRVSNDNDVEGFGELIDRIGITPFKEKVYG